MKRRQIESPIAGVIAERYHNVGEWAQAGEPIYRVVHMDRLRVEGMLNVADLTPEEIASRPDDHHLREGSCDDASFLVDEVEVLGED